MKSIEYTRQKIREIIALSSVPEDPVHSRNTLAWLLKLKPDADDAMQIAALGHDIDRALAERKVQRTDFANYDEFKAAHARNSAEILKEIMLKCSVQDHIIEDVYRLVCRHETGGDQRADLIRDADSISFFEVNLPFYYERSILEETKRRCIWGYKRLSAKVKPFVVTFSYCNRELTALVKQVVVESESKLR